MSGMNLQVLGIKQPDNNIDILNIFYYISKQVCKRKY